MASATVQQIGGFRRETMRGAVLASRDEAQLGLRIRWVGNFGENEELGLVA